MIGLSTNPHRWVRAELPNVSTSVFDQQLKTVPSEGPSWLAMLRQRALASFQAHGFPTTKNEDWHFTSPAPIAESDFSPMQSAATLPSPRAIDALLVGDASWPALVFVNGRYAPSLSRTAGIPEGVRVMSLASALLEEPTLLEAHLGKLAAFESQAMAFSALNTALMRDGAVLHVAPNVTMKTPLHILFVSDERANGGVSYPRNLFVLEAHSRLPIIEQYASLGGGKYLTNSVVECVVGAGATLEHYRVQRESRESYHVGHVEALQGRDSHYISFSFVTGAALSRQNIYTALNGEGCGSTLNGLYMLDGDQTCDHQTRIEHVAPNCFSREVYKGILDGTSHGVFNGKVYVHPEAQKTDGKQTNKTLLLSERARIDTKPQLEIFADDVKCTHGATVGRLDEMATFYMKSRGVAADTTRRLLTYAFAADVLETIEVEPVKLALEEMTLARFL